MRKNLWKSQVFMKKWIIPCFVCSQVAALCSLAHASSESETPIFSAEQLPTDGMLAFWSYSGVATKSTNSNDSFGCCRTEHSQATPETKHNSIEIRGAAFDLKEVC